jgi:hypothetical protein
MIRVFKFLNKNDCINDDCGAPAVKSLYAQAWGVWMPYGIQQIIQQQLTACALFLKLICCLFCMTKVKCPTNVVGFCRDCKIKFVKVLLLRVITSVCFKAV